MNLMADECINLQIVNHLRKEEHDVVSVLELYPSISDDTVLQMSSQKNSLLLTSDKDFGELVFRHNSVSAGVILL